MNSLWHGMLHPREEVMGVFSERKWSMKDDEEKKEIERLATNSALSNCVMQLLKENRK
jgi:hypothetical protein